MLERASGQFIIDGQVEDILGGISGAARIARISQTCRFSGQLEGESMAEFTAVMPRDADGSFHGFQRVSGNLGEREGSFVLSVTGEMHKGQPRGSWTIVPKSGSGDFVHIRGGGTFSLPNGKPGAYALEFDLRKPRAAKSSVMEVGDELVEDVIVPAVAVVEAPVVPVERPARKSRGKNAEPEVAVIAEQPVKRSRPRKAAPVLAEPVVAVEQPARRSRARKTEPAPAQPIVVSEPPVKRTRSRNLDPAPAEHLVAPAKPKRARKPAPEPAPPTVLAELVPESAPTKPARRKQTMLPEPIALPQPSPARKRRSKAA